MKFTTKLNKVKYGVIRAQLSYVVVIGVNNPPVH